MFSKVLLGGLHRINGQWRHVYVCIAILVSVDCCGKNNLGIKWGEREESYPTPSYDTLNYI